jgi:hypothetical protein
LLQRWGSHWPSVTTATTTTIALCAPGPYLLWLDPCSAPGVPEPPAVPPCTLLSAPCGKGASGSFNLGPCTQSSLPEQYLIHHPHLVSTLWKGSKDLSILVVFNPYRNQLMPEMVKLATTLMAKHRACTVKDLEAHTIHTGPNEYFRIHHTYWTQRILQDSAQALKGR